MVQCFASGCSHRSDENDTTDTNCQVNVKFPVQKSRRNKWILAVRRADEEPHDESVLCTCHFPDGNFKATPSIFPWNKSKSFHAFQSPEKKKYKKRGKTALAPLTPAPSSSSLTDSQSCSFSENLLSEGKWSCPGVYEAELYFKDREIEDLKKTIKQLTKRSFGYQRVTTDELCEHFTGLDLNMFNLIINLCKLLPIEYYKSKPVRAVSFEDQVLLTLMKLRLNSSYIDLGVRFGVSSSTAFRIVYAILPLIHQVVYHSIMDKIPGQRKNKTSMPSSYQTFSNCRIVIDCTEMQCEIPKSMQCQKMTWSAYKKKNTNKILTAVAPNGSITFCSNAYPGSTSDKAIVKHCGILNHLQPGDLILADKGFLIYDLLPSGVGLNIPPFLVNPQFTASEVKETRNIARARIHIERANIRIKRYRIMSFIPKSLFSRISMVIQTCVGLVNFKNPLIKSMTQDFLVQVCESDSESHGEETESNVADDFDTIDELADFLNDDD